MALTETRPDTAGPTPSGDDRPAPGSGEQLLGTGDHVALGRLLIGASLMFGIVWSAALVAAGIDALTSNGLLGTWAPGLATSALVGLALLTAAPLLLGVAVIVVPLQLGSPAIAFPRALALAVWTWALSGLVFLVSVAIDGGVGGTNDQATRLGNVALGAVLAALGLGAVCLATTVMSHRPEGMTLPKVPFLSWASLLAASLWIATLASAFAHIVLGQVSRAGATTLGVIFADGVAWLLRAPAVYVLAIPVLGIALDAASTASGKRLRQYGVGQGLLGAYAILSFGAWAQLPAAVNTALWTIFALLIAVPILGTLGAVGDILRQGRSKATPALVCSVFSLFLLLGSVAAGLTMALDRAGSGQIFDLNQVALASAQGYFVIGAALLGGLGGLFQWAPQIWGRDTATPPSIGAGLLVLAGAAVLGTGGLGQGLSQQNGADTAAQFWGLVTAVGGVLVVLGILGTFAAMLRAARDADDGGSTEVEGLTLEWAFPLPVQGGTVPEDLPAVTSPYPLADAREGGTEERS